MPLRGKRSVRTASAASARPVVIVDLWESSRSHDDDYEQLKRAVDHRREEMFRRSYEQAAPEAAAAQALDAELAGVKRSALSAKEKARLLERVGYDRYMAIPSTTSRGTPSDDTAGDGFARGHVSCARRALAPHSWPHARSHRPRRRRTRCSIPTTRRPQVRRAPRNIALEADGEHFPKPVLSAMALHSRGRCMLRSERSQCRCGFGGLRRNHDNRNLRP